MTAMRNSQAAGIYLVGWFDTEKWEPEDPIAIGDKLHIVIASAEAEHDRREGRNRSPKSSAGSDLMRKDCSFLSHDAGPSTPQVLWYVMSGQTRG